MLSENAKSVVDDTCVPGLSLLNADKLIDLPGPRLWTVAEESLL